MYLGLGEGDVGGGCEPREVVLHVLEDEVERAGGARGDEALEPDDVGVALQAAEDEDLPRHEPHALRLQAVEPHLLERHHAARRQLPRAEYAAVRALPHLLQLLEPLRAERDPPLHGLGRHGAQPRRPPGGGLLAFHAPPPQKRRRGRVAEAPGLLLVSVTGEVERLQPHRPAPNRRRQAAGRGVRGRRHVVPRRRRHPGPRRRAPHGPRRRGGPTTTLLSQETEEEQETGEGSSGPAPPPSLSVSLTLAQVMQAIC
jgi:hypothetical protein